MLIAGIWTYRRSDDEVREAIAVERVEASAEDQAALDRRAGAQVKLRRASQEQAASRENLELRREAYGTVAASLAVGYWLLAHLRRRACGAL